MDKSTRIDGLGRNRHGVRDGATLPSPTTLNNSGWLNVGDGHNIYFEDRGNKDAEEVVFHIHGGPGANFNEKHMILYDFSRHRVIFFDQRGCGKSTPFASPENNTTQDLIGDIELLRLHLGFEKIKVVGGSWGSTLNLLYAIAHPERVSRILVWSIFLARQFEVDFVNDGRLRMWFPEEWDRFIKPVPEIDRTSGNAIMAYYARQIRDDNPEVAQSFADEWTLWEETLCSIGYDPIALQDDVVDSERSVAVAKLETHYFLNGCFVEEGYILQNIGKISHIPCHVVHGRFDMCTPPVAAYDLEEAYGQMCMLRFVNSGHLRTDP